jgi:carbon monoxide dehydrogenase subunit G
MQQTMQNAFVVDTTRERAWAFLWDLEAVAKCVPGCEEVLTQEPSVSYKARVRRNVGPFLIRFELDITVIATLPLERIQVAVSGEDKRLRSKVQQNITVSLNDVGNGRCQIEIITDFRLSGMLAALGEGLLAGQIRQEIDTFVGSVQNALQERVSETTVSS